MIIVRKRSSYTLQSEVIGPQQFISIYGREAYRRVPTAAILRDGHRKGIALDYCQNLSVRS